MKYALLAAVAASLLLVSTAAVPQALEGPGFKVTLDVTKDTPILCAADLLNSLNEKEAGKVPAHGVLEEYAGKAKLTDIQKDALGRDCAMFFQGATFAAMLSAAAESGAFEPPVSLVPPTVETAIEK